MQYPNSYCFLVFFSNSCILSNILLQLEKNHTTMLLLEFFIVLYCPPPVCTAAVRAPVCDSGVVVWLPPLPGVCDSLPLSPTPGATSLPPAPSGAPPASHLLVNKVTQHLAIIQVTHLVFHYKEVRYRQKLLMGAFSDLCCAGNMIVTCQEEPERQALQEFLQQRAQGLPPSRALQYMRARGSLCPRHQLLVLVECIQQSNG